MENLKIQDNKEYHRELEKGLCGIQQNIQKLKGKPNEIEWILTQAEELIPIQESREILAFIQDLYYDRDFFKSNGLDYNNIPKKEQDLIKAGAAKYILEQKKTQQKSKN